MFGVYPAWHKLGATMGGGWGGKEGGDGSGGFVLSSSFISPILRPLGGDTGNVKEGTRFSVATALGRVEERAHPTTLGIPTPRPVSWPHGTASSRARPVARPRWTTAHRWESSGMVKGLASIGRRRRMRHASRSGSATSEWLWVHARHTAGSPVRHHARTRHSVSRWWLSLLLVGLSPARRAKHISN